MNAPMIVPATIRGRSALQEVRALLDLLAVIDNDIESMANIEGDPEKPGAPSLSVCGMSVMLTFEEMHDLLQRRRDGVLNRLENKGIRIAPDPQTVVAQAPAPQVIESREEIATPPPFNECDQAVEAN